MKSSLLPQLSTSSLSLSSTSPLTGLSNSSAAAATALVGGTGGGLGGTAAPLSSSVKSTAVAAVGAAATSVISNLRYHHIHIKKMFTRRNWLLRCSILINVAVILYVCSHVMIGGGGNFATGPAYIIQDEGNNHNNMRQVVISNNIESKRTNLPNSSGGGVISTSDDTVVKAKEQDSSNSNLEHEQHHKTDKNIQHNTKLKDSIVPAAVAAAAAAASHLGGNQDDDNSPIMHLAHNYETNIQTGGQLINIQHHLQQEHHKEQQSEHLVVAASSGGSGSDIESIQKEPLIITSNGGSGNNNIINGVIVNTNENINGNGNEEKRFELPTDPNEIAAQEKSQSEIAGQPDPVGFVNNSNTDNYVASGDEKDFEDRLRSILKCHDRDYKPETVQRGDFWVLKNYVRAEHGELKCHETITYTTHADYTFLDNLIPLLERWNSPVSIALHAPGNDFQPTINSIKYLRDCLPESNLVRQFVTFHLYFSTKHIPKNVPKSDKVLEQAFNCTIPPPFINVSIGHLYKTQKKLLYPVNVGRNIARDSAQTHFILASDIELYPNPGLVKKFLEMIARNDAYLQRKFSRVFPLSIFEVESSVPVPKDKTELQELLRTNKAIPFHKRVCSSCHGVPKSKEWMAANETEELGVFHIGKRVGYFVHWEPIYIGTHADPHYDERLSWEGKSDKMTQGYALCVLDYEFHILDNAFLVHKPGIKVLKKDPRRAMLAAKTNQLIRKIIYPELRIMYGIRKGCAV